VSKIGRYKIVREIGRGEQPAILYEAFDPKFGRPVSIKTIVLNIPDPTEDASLVRERYVREARIAAALVHPNIVTVYDAFQKHGNVHIVMESVNGQSLKQALPELLQQPIQRRLEILEEASAALNFAHSKGMFHRGISPSKIVIDERGHAKIDGFGTAQLAEPPFPHVVAIGPLHYLAPEQVKGGLPTERTDQFALAAVAYLMLTGREPFQGDSIQSRLYKLVMEPATAPSSLNPALGPEVDRVLDNAMAKDPGNRLDSCTGFLEALKAAVKMSMRTDTF